MSRSHVVFVDDVLRAPFHDFIPRFFGPDYLGGSRDGGECGLPSSGVRPGKRLRPRSIADRLAKPESRQRRSLRCRKDFAGGDAAAASAFLRHASSDRGNALAPTTVQNPFLRPAQ